MQPELIAQIQAKYDGEWVAIRITETDRKGEPVKGIVIAHNPDKEAVVNAEWGMDTECPIWVTFCGKLPEMDLLPSVWLTDPVPEPIAYIEARYQDEWLAIEVTETNRKGQPFKGTLIAHSRDHDEVISAVRDRKGFIMVIYNGEPECEVILSGNLSL